MSSQILKQSLKPLKIVVAVTGSVAAYKSVELVRRLKEQGALVRVVMTAGGLQFVSATTFQAVCGHPVETNLFSPNSANAMDHIALARWADLIVIAPASANCIARLAHGFADDVLTSLCLATVSPIMLVPAMNQGMWAHPMVQDNIARLQSLTSILLVGPAEGSQACGDVGLGRMVEPALVIDAIAAWFEQKLNHQSQSLAKKKILITAGPTRESLDPVRYLTNHSSGKMGYAMAEAAQACGAYVTLISGPTALPSPKGIKRISVTTAQEMFQAVLDQLTDQPDIFIGAAAVSDYHVDAISINKIKKQSSPLVLTLHPNPDILAQVAQSPQRPRLVVGFAAETDAVISQASDKLLRKKIDMIIANKVSQTQGFYQDHNTVTVLSTVYLSKENTLSKHEQAIQRVDLPAMSKRALAAALMNMMAEALRVQVE